MSQTTNAESKLGSTITPPPASTSLSLDGELDGELANTSKISFKNLSLKQLYQNQWQNMRSWGSFIDTNKMKTPTSTIQWSKRVMRNIEHFQSNYVCVFFILVGYCILTSPLLLLAIAAALGACYIITLRNSESPIKVFNYQLSLGQQYLVIGLASFPLFYLAGAGSAVFWVLGASFFVIGLHASIFASEINEAELTDNPFQVFTSQPVQSV